MLVETTPVFPRANAIPVTTNATASVVMAKGPLLIEMPLNVTERLALLDDIFKYYPELCSMLVMLVEP
jgi:hypothetical protein